MGSKTPNDLHMNAASALTPESTPRRAESDDPPRVVTLKLHPATPTSSRYPGTVTVSMTPKQLPSSSRKREHGTLTFTVQPKPFLGDHEYGASGVHLLKILPVAHKSKQTGSTTGTSIGTPVGNVTFTMVPKPSVADMTGTVTVKPGQEQPSTSITSTHGDPPPEAVTVNKDMESQESRNGDQVPSAQQSPSTYFSDLASATRVILKPKRSGSASKSKGKDPGTSTVQPKPSTSSASSTSSKDTKMVYQFKISLTGRFKPPIWRRVHVPEEFTFRELHQSIQCLYGWSGHHLHMFEMGDGKRPTVPRNWRDCEDEEEFVRLRKAYQDLLDVEPVRPRGDFLIKDYFKTDGQIKAIYDYDLGSAWRHIILLESILPAKPRTKYPLCTAGRSRTPPEDPTESEWEEYESNPPPNVFDKNSVKFNFDSLLNMPNDCFHAEDHM